MNPASLISIGVYGATCFVLVALAGVIWQQVTLSGTARPDRGSVQASVPAQRRSVAAVEPAPKVTVVTPPPMPSAKPVPQPPPPPPPAPVAETTVPTPQEPAKAAPEPPAKVAEAPAEAPAKTTQAPVAEAPPKPAAAPAPAAPALKGPVVAAATPTEERARHTARGDFSKYLNGPIADLLGDIERQQSELGSIGKDTRSPEESLQILQIMRQRTKSVFAGLDQIVKRHSDLPIVQSAEWTPPASLDNAMGEAIKMLQAVPGSGNRQQTARAIANDTATAQLSIAVGELSIWIQRQRRVLATLL